MNSNSQKCLLVERKDRRLLVPKVTEIKWPKKKFDDLYHWLFVGDGLGIIYDRCHKQNDYVSEGDDAPMTAARDRMIAEARSIVDVAADDLADWLAEEKWQIARTRCWIMEQLKELNDKQQRRASDRQIMDRFRKKSGLIVLSDANRIKYKTPGSPSTVKEHMEAVAINAKAYAAIKWLFKVSIEDGVILTRKAVRTRIMTGRGAEWVDVAAGERVTVGDILREKEPQSISELLRRLSDRMAKAWPGTGTD